MGTHRKVAARKTPKKPSRRAGVPKKARARKAPKAVKPTAPAYPPNFPVVPGPADDPLMGREFDARVNCELVPTKKGKLINRCEKQRVVVRGVAAPSAEKPKRKQVYAVQKGTEFIIPDRELKRDLARRDRNCGALAERVQRGEPVPRGAYEKCPTLPDAPELAEGGDTSFDPGKFNGRKPNHHAGHHAPGDPLGVYLPPLAQWKGMGTFTWIHPVLRWKFSIESFGESRGKIEIPGVRREYESLYYATPQDAWAALRNAYATLSTTEPQRAMRELEWYDESHARKPNARREVREPDYKHRLTEAQMDAYLREQARFAPHYGKKVKVYRLGTSIMGPPEIEGTLYSVRIDPVPRMDRPARITALVDTNRGSYEVPLNQYMIAIRKENRAPRGTAHGHSYVPSKPDPLIGQRIGGENYYGEVRAPALDAQGRPAHIVGGHIMSRARAQAGVRREDIRTGKIPAPPSRRRVGPPIEVKALPADEGLAMMRAIEASPLGLPAPEEPTMHKALRDAQARGEYVMRVVKTPSGYTAPEVENATGTQVFSVNDAYDTVEEITEAVLREMKELWHLPNDTPVRRLVVEAPGSLTSRLLDDRVVTLRMPPSTVAPPPSVTLGGRFTVPRGATVDPRTMPYEISTLAKEVVAFRAPRENIEAAQRAIPELARLKITANADGRSVVYLRGPGADEMSERAAKAVRDWYKAGKPATVEAAPSLPVRPTQTHDPEPQRDISVGAPYRTSYIGGGIYTIEGPTRSLEKMVLSLPRFLRNRKVSTQVNPLLGSVTMRSEAAQKAAVAWLNANLAMVRSDYEYATAARAPQESIEDLRARAEATRREVESRGLVVRHGGGRIEPAAPRAVSTFRGEQASRVHHAHARMHDLVPANEVDQVLHDHAVEAMRYLRDPAATLSDAEAEAFARDMVRRLEAAVDESRARRARVIPPPLSSRDEELKRAMLEELQRAGINVKPNGAAARHHRGYAVPPRRSAYPRY